MTNNTYIVFVKNLSAEQLQSDLAKNLSQDVALHALQIPEPLPQSNCYKLDFSIPVDVKLLQDFFTKRQADFFKLDAQFNIKLAMFDMDSTLIQAEVMDELARFYGVYDKVSAITESAMRGEIDFNQSFTQRLAMLKDMPTEDLEKIRNNIKFTPNAQILFEHLNKFNVETILVSGGFDYFASHFAEKLKIKEFHANVLQAKNYKLTGQAVHPILNSEFKQRLLEQKQADLNLDKNQIMAVGDGANDIPMLLKAGLGFAYKAKPLVQERAKFKLNFNDLDALAYMPYLAI